MMKIKVAEVGEALHPSEIIVSVKTTKGTESVVLDRRSIKDGTISVGHPIRRHDGAYLVELPRESQSGSWRVWVNENQVAEQERMPA